MTGGSAAAGKEDRGDALVRIGFPAGNEEPGIAVTSPVRDMFGEQQDRIISRTLEELGIGPVILEIRDNHALDWVLRARIIAAARRLERMP